MAPRQPSLTSPTRFSSGTRTSAKKTSLKAEAPLICLIGRISMPGDSMSTMKYVMSACLAALGSVRVTIMP